MKPESYDSHARNLLTRTTEEVLPFLRDNQAPQLDTLQKAVEVLEAALRQRGRLAVGFVGQAQVGKSSLINAILERTALPAGGIGPLTASATRVTYAADPRITVSYHGKKQIKSLRASIENHLRHRGLVKGSEEPIEDDEESIANVEPTEIVGDDSAAAEARAEATRKMEFMMEQGRRLLGASPSSGSEPQLPERLVLEGIRAVLGLKVRCAPEELEPLRERIWLIQQKLGQKEILVQSALGGPTQFNKELRLRAAGLLAPLVSELEVAVDSEVVRHLDLTDLPGIGVVGDPAATVAQDFVQAEGGALVLVMQNAGLTEELARLLERTGVITRLLFGSREGTTAIKVLVAVTRLDDVAKERHMAAVDQALEEDARVPAPDEIFTSLAEQMHRTVAQQLEVALRNSPAFEGLQGDQLGRRDTVVRELCQGMFVRCVAAPEFSRMVSANSVKHSTFLQERATTGVPDFQEALKSLARDVEGFRENAVRAAADRLSQLVSGHLIALEELYKEKGGRAEQSWGEFRDSLLQLKQSLSPQVAGYHKEALGILKEAIPPRIETLCAEAKNVANTRLARLRGTGRQLHYQSLNAALLRSGIWEKRGVDYPDALTRSLVDYIAGEWEPRVLTKVRSTMKDVAERSLVLVEQLCAEAQKHDARLVTDAQIEAQQALLKEEAQTVVAWAKEKLEALREEVQKDLYKTALRPIEKACRDAADRGDNRNPGAKERILEALDEGGRRAIEKASERALELLQEHYAVLHKALREEYLTDSHDPVSAAYEALTNEKLRSARRSDAQTRRHILEKLEQLRQYLLPAA